jgi:CBS domain-containing protein
MKIGEVCTREVTYTHESERVDAVARLMREHHVGALVVVGRDESRGLVPVGIVTDRDIVVEVLAGGLDYRTVSVGEIMTRDPVSVGEGEDVLDALKIMRRQGVRRLPVLTRAGTLAGIVAIDDLLELVAEQFDDLVKAIASEQSREAQVRT